MVPGTAAMTAALGVVTPTMPEEVGTEKENPTGWMRWYISDLTC